MIVLGSPDSPRLSQVITGLKTGLPGRALSVVRVAEFDREGQENVRRLRAQRPPLFVVLGTPALMALAPVEKQTPMVFAMVANPYFTGAAYHPGNPGVHQQNVTGLASPPPVAATLEQGARLLGPCPWGLLYDPLDGEAVEVAARFTAAAPKLGLTPVLEKSSDAASDPPGLKKLLKRGARVIYLPPTTSARRYASIIMAWGQRGKVLVVSGHPECPHQGAILWVSLDYERLGEEAAVLARRVLAGESPSRIPIAEKIPLKLEVDERLLDRWIGYPPPSRLNQTSSR